MLPLCYAAPQTKLLLDPIRVRFAKYEPKRTMKRWKNAKCCEFSRSAANCLFPLMNIPVEINLSIGFSVSRSKEPFPGSKNRCTNSNKCPQRCWAIWLRYKLFQSSSSTCCLLSNVSKYKHFGRNGNIYWAQDGTVDPGSKYESQSYPFSKWLYGMTQPLRMLLF